MTGSAPARFAAGVSRALTKQGMRPLPSGADLADDGVRVYRSQLPGTAAVSIDYADRPGQVREVTGDVTVALWRAGYVVGSITSTGTLHVERGELGSAVRPRSGARLGDKCPQCKAEGVLWSNWFTGDGLGCSGDASGARWLTVCQSCGDFYETGQAGPR